MRCLLPANTVQLTLFNKNENIQRVTVGQLLAMKSGIKDYDDYLVSACVSNVNFSAQCPRL